MSKRKSYSSAKGRRDSGQGYLGIPHKVLNSTNYCQLSNHARAMLNCIGVQYKGSNNGDLSATWRYLKGRGWKSKDTISKAIQDLEHFGVIVCVQRGGLNCGGRKRPSLYALSWRKIDNIGYSDSFVGPSDWNVGDMPGTWKTNTVPP